MGELRTDDLRKLAHNPFGEDIGWELALRAAADEIDRLRELVDVLKSIPGASITDANYDALADAVANPPGPNSELRALMSGASITEEE